MSLRLIFRITALVSSLSHKGLTSSTALFCEKFPRKSIANTYADKFLSSEKTGHAAETPCVPAAPNSLFHRQPCRTAAAPGGERSSPDPGEAGVAPPTAARRARRVKFFSGFSSSHRPVLFCRNLNYLNPLHSKHLYSKNRNRFTPNLLLSYKYY
jgi:hypothetical protein